MRYDKARREEEHRIRGPRTTRRGKLGGTRVWGLRSTRGWVWVWVCVGGVGWGGWEKERRRRRRGGAVFLPSLLWGGAAFPSSSLSSLPSLFEFSKTKLP